MKKILIVLMLFLSVNMGKAAQDPKASPNPGSAVQQRDAALTMEGEITRVDEQHNLFSLAMPDGREMQFSFAQDTPITGAPGATQGLLTKLEKGMHVKVEYDNVGGSNVVTKIEIQPAKG